MTAVARERLAERAGRDAMEALKADVRREAEADGGERLAGLDTSKLQEALALAEQRGDPSSAGVGRALREAGVPEDAAKHILAGAQREEEPGRSASVEVEPAPAFVVKAFRSGDLSKVFINLCGSDALPAPADWHHGSLPLEVKEHLEQLESGSASASEPVPDALRFPLSCDSGRLEPDSHNANTLTHDVVLASDIVQQAMASPRFQRFLAQLALSYVAQKSNIELQDSFKLPKRRYVGSTVRKQRIRASRTTHSDTSTSRTAPVIEEVNAAESPSASEPEFALRPVKGTTAEHDESSSLPYLSTSLSFQGKPFTTDAIVRIGVPRKRDPSDLRIAVVGDRVHIDAPDRAHSQVDLPFDVDVQQAVADIESGMRAVQVRLPRKPLSTIADEALNRQRPAATPNQEAREQHQQIKLAGTSLDDLD